MDKFLELLAGSKITDAGLYSLIAFASFCPGFMVLYVMVPEVVKDFDFSKLLLFCAAVSCACLIAFLSVTHISQMNSKLQLDFRHTLLFSSIVSSACVYFVLLIMIKSNVITLGSFVSGMQIGLAVVALVVSYAVADKEAKWYKKFFFNFGGLFSLSLLPMFAGLFL